MLEKSFRSGLLLALMLCLTSLSDAHAIGLNALGGVSMTNTSTVNIASSDPIFRGTLGVDVDFGIAPLFSLEAGLYYQNRGWSKNKTLMTQQGLSSSYESADYLTVPVLVRFAAIPGILKIGLGPYFSYALGNFFSSSTTTTGQVNPPSYQPFADANRNKADFGGLVSVRGSIPVLPLVDVLADLRFQYSFTNLNTNPNLVTRYYDLIFMVGARIGL